jgi:hypothetical protein
MLREGRGKGRGENYKPWLTVRDLSSKGESTRMPAWRTGRRLVHLFSKLERDFFYTVEWMTHVTDYREQFLLDLEETVQIAKDLNLRHPVSPQSRRYWPMTTDLLVTTIVNGEESHFARSVKPFAGVEIQGSPHPKQVKNNWEKFQIEFEYWKRRGIKLAWVTEKDFSAVLAKNVRHVHGFFHVGSLSPLSQVEVHRVGDVMFSRVKNGESLARAGCAADAQFGLQPGSSVRVALHKIATKKWKIDFRMPFNTDRPLNVWEN